MRYVAAFRTYTWNDTIAALCKRFFDACKSARHVILADETRGSLGITGFEVISHTEETEIIDLLKYPQNESLWYNVDYGVYILRNALPDFDYYLFSESDLAVNIDLDPVVFEASRRKLDIITHNVAPSTEGWHWHSNGAAVFKNPWRSLLFFMVLSPRAIDLLFETRRAHTVAFREGRLVVWPFCEAFVPSVLKDAAMSFASVSEFADTRDLDFRPRIEFADERASRPGSLVHSVLGRSDFLRAVIQEENPREYLYSCGDLSKTLNKYPVEEFRAMLENSFQEKLDYAGLQKFYEILIEQGISVQPSDDLAYCKPSICSSVSLWSRSQDPQIEAAGANGRVLNDDYGFHTDKEFQPWWAVDLLNEFVIDLMFIVNRAIERERFTHFFVESSLDFNTWTSRYAKFDANEVSCSYEAPYSIEFKESFLARFVRIRLMGEGIMHLRSIKIFGRSVGPRVHKKYVE